MSSSKLTPMIKQYLSIKDDYPDAILLYRMGDFYEMFGEDAEEAAPILEIALTSRAHGKATDRVPLAGIPHHALEKYLGRLIDAGKKVVICEQTEDPKLAKGLVKREVVRVITPGMIIENELLDARANNWVLCVARNAKAAGLACLDLSTATFRLTQSDSLDALIEEVRRIAPKEVLLNEADRQNSEIQRLATAIGEVALTDLPAAARKYLEFLEERLGTLILGVSVGCDREAMIWTETGVST